MKFKKAQKVPGFAFAIFDNQNVIFTDCLGKSTLGFEINKETLFSLQSISKNITALAAMKAVQDGLVKLDLPISEYLPAFSINSCFESSPEQKITLRMLLSHTAGFTHEAPVGNNYDYSPCSVEDHLTSIQKTWLKFPAGTNYAYSNLGFDLASSVISQKAGIEFNEFLKSEIFLPLSMEKTTADDNEVIRNRNRTEGNIPAVKNKHYSIPLPGSGAVYTNLSDFIKYVQFLMNDGAVQNDTLIDKKYLAEMFKINLENYGLGTYIDKLDDIFYINHNGGGFGYSATLLWFPEYNLGSVILCNKPCNTFDICFSSMADYIKSNGLSKEPHITAEFDTLNGHYFRNKNSLEKGKVYTCTCDSVFKPQWEEYTGKYSIVMKGMDFKWYVKLAHFLGIGYQNIFIKKGGQVLKMTGTAGESVLKEYQPGLFFTDNYEVFDLRSDKPIFRNITVLKKK